MYIIYIHHLSFLHLLLMYYQNNYLQRDDAHFYGYVFFRQVRDKTLKRGYFQKSVVFLSSLPYFNFFKEIADIIAPEYFDNGEPCLESGNCFYFLIIR